METSRLVDLRVMVMVKSIGDVINCRGRGEGSRGRGVMVNGDTRIDCAYGEN